MIEHTKEPWRWEFNAKHKTVQIVGGVPAFDLTIMDFERWGMGGAVPRFRDTEHDGMNIMYRLCDRPDWIAPFQHREHHADWCANVIHPDARRIVACVNACAHVSTEDLESAEPGQLKDSLDGMCAVIARIEQQRDKLLEALEEVIRISDRKHDAWDNAIAIAAIADAEAAKTQTGNQKQLVDQDETGAMMNLANKIVESAYPEEDSRLEVAYAIARHLGLDWPSAQQQGEPVAWRLKIGDSDLWSYCGEEWEADFHGKHSGVSKYEKQPLYTAQPAQESSVSDEATSERVRTAIVEALGDAYDCTRVWSAWGVGTMGPDDFSLVAEDDERIAEITDAAMKAMLAATPKPEGGEA